MKNFFFYLCLLQSFVFASGKDNPFSVFQNKVVNVCEPVLSLEMGFASYKDSYSKSAQILSYLESEKIKVNETVEGLVLRHFEARKKGDLDIMMSLHPEEEADLIKKSYSRISHYPDALKKYESLKFIGKTYFNDLVRIRFDMIGNGARSFPMALYARQKGEFFHLVDNISNNHIIAVFGGGHPVNSETRTVSPLSMNDVINDKQITFFVKAGKLNFQLQSNSSNNSKETSTQNSITVYLKPSFYEKPANEAELNFLERLVDYATKGELESIRNKFAVSEEAFLSRTNNHYVEKVSSQLNNIVDVEYLFKLDGSKHCSIFYGQPKTKKVGSFVLAKVENRFELNARMGNRWLNRIVASSELMSAISYWQYKPE